MLLKEFQSDVYDEEELAKFFENFDHHSDYFRNNYFNVLRYMVTKSPVFRATTYGGWGVTVEKTKDFAPALDKAMKRKGIRLIHCVTDVEHITNATTIKELRAKAKTKA